MKKNYAFSLDKDKIDKLDIEAKAEGRSRSSMLNRILMERYNN